jgi:hypothetical protein
MPEINILPLFFLFSPLSPQEIRALKYTPGSIYMGKYEALNV